MEEEEIARRIRQIREIEIAMDESGEGKTPYTDAIRNAIQYMTPDEIRENLLRMLDKLDALHSDQLEAQALRRKDAEAHQLEISMLKDEMSGKLAAKDSQLAAKDSQLADKDSQLADKDREIASLKDALARKESENADANHKVSSMNHDKFQGTSKRGIDKDRMTSKGRDDDRDDFDGTPGSAAPADGDAHSHTPDVEKISKDIAEIRKEQSKNRGKYTLASAGEKILYECDLSMLPEGAVFVKKSIETVFDEERIIRAYQYEMATYRIKETALDEDGNTVEKWVEHTTHFRKIVRKTTDENGTEKKVEEEVQYESGNLPDQVPGTKTTRRMLAMLILQHLEAHVPINRLAEIFADFNFNIGRSTLGGWLEKGAAMFEKAYGKLLDRVLADNAITYCDETWERLHLKDITKKVYTWIVGNKAAKSVAYVYDDGSRGRRVLVDLLSGRKIRAMHTDGYTAYYYLSDAGIEHLGCCAHLWRKVKEWYELTADPDARLILLDLQSLYRQEAEMKEEGAPPEEVLRRRNSEETTKAITRIKARLELLHSNIDKYPKIGQTAINYALGMLAKVFKWREDPDYELDNNFAERAARPVALSRKTSYFNCSHHGAKSRSILRSFVETCRLQGVGVLNYMVEYFNAVCSGRTDYDNLLPATIYAVALNQGR